MTVSAGEWVMGFKLLMIFLLCFCTIQCAQEDVSRSEPPQIKLGGPGRQCLSSAGETIDKFLKGDLPDSELIDFWDCFNGAIATFLDFTKGNSTGIYTGAEIRSFLKSFFLGNLIITDPLLDQIMQLKRVFIGGSDIYFTKEEILLGQQRIEDLKKVTQILNPHIKIIYDAFSGDADKSNVTYAQFKGAMAGIDNTFEQLSGLFTRTSESYYFSDFKILLEEIFMLTRRSDPEGAAAWTKLTPLFIKIKQIFVGGFDEAIESSEWRQLNSAMSVIMQTVCRWNYYLTDSEFGDLTSLREFEEIYRGSDEVFKEALFIHPGNTIPFQLVDEAFEELGRLIEFPLGLSALDFSGIFRMLVRKILTPADDSHTIVEGISFIHFKKLRDEFFYWSRSQAYANAIVENPKNPPLPIHPAEFELHRTALEGPWKILINKESILKIDWTRDFEFDLKSITTLNWQRTLIRLIIQSFSKDEERRKNLSFLTLKELKEAQMAFGPLGEALGLFEAGDTSFADRILRESSLFMPRSDGDELISYEEGVEYLAYVLSGLNVQTKIFADLAEICPIIRNDNGDEFVEITCFREQTWLQKNAWLSHLPNMQEYFKNDIDGSQWRYFEKFQEMTVRKEGFSDQPISKADIMEMWILLQYIETFYGRFDTGLPFGTINVTESLDAYEVYGPYLQVLLKKYPLGSGERRGLFTYLMRYGKIHFLDDVIGGAIKFIWWLLNEKKWSYEADRTRLVQILASLAEFQSDSSESSFRGPSGRHLRELPKNNLSN